MRWIMCERNWFTIGIFMISAAQEATSDGKLVSKQQLPIASLTPETLHVVDVYSCTHDVIVTA